ncbi:MAG: glycosyltransferase, partial [Patescibacteria group bacterium]
EAKKYNPQIIHAILETFAGEALMRCKDIMPFARRILTLQTTNRTFRKKKILQSPHVVTAISMHLAGIANEMREGGLKIIPNGIDYKAIRLACAKYPKVSGRILFVGRLEKMKGVDLLLKAYARANSEFGVRNSELHIVGDGSQRSTLENLARKLGIADRVVFKGYMRSSDVNREYAEAEIFCGLSRSEALGNVFIEAQAAGCAMVASRAGGIAEVVEDGKSAILVDPQDIDSVAKALQALLGKNDRADTSKVADYDWNLIAKRYAEVYKSITLGQS